MHLRFFLLPQGGLHGLPTGLTGCARVNFNPAQKPHPATMCTSIHDIPNGEGPPWGCLPPSPMGAMTLCLQKRSTGADP